MAQVLPRGEPSARGQPALKVVHDAGDLGHRVRRMLRPEAHFSNKETEAQAFKDG